jgi:hypothetical protein
MASAHECMPSARRWSFSTFAYAWTVASRLSRSPVAAYINAPSLAISLNETPCVVTGRSDRMPARLTSRFCSVVWPLNRAYKSVAISRRSGSWVSAYKASRISTPDTSRA